MATRSVSPGGALLRASRVFAIPSPLPRPKTDLNSNTIRNSDSATLPYPVHLSITTPQASLVRGDWGFKRPLPLRSTTRTSTPVIRVDAIDTFEHITEFGSSADHAISLQKWQEMGVPLSAPPTAMRSVLGEEKRISVFDNDIDFTATEGSSEDADTRWKFKGPWLAGQTEGYFKEYVSTEVRKRKQDFRQFLRTQCANALTAEARRNTVGQEIPPVVAPSEVTEEQMAKYMKGLRGEGRPELYKHIRAFFDLPPPPQPKLQDSFGMFMAPTNPGPDTLKSADVSISNSRYSENGPPKTHPSAGLSYTRSASKMFNHPEFGPQKQNAPIQGRVVLPKSSASNYHLPALGVGGFVAAAPENTWGAFNVGGKIRRSSQTPTAIDGLDKVEAHKVGGSKAYLRPTHATIDLNGRVMLSVECADEDAVAVLEGTTDKIPRMKLWQSSSPKFSKYGSSSTSPTSNSSADSRVKSDGYGLSSR